MFLVINIKTKQRLQINLKNRSRQGKAERSTFHIEGIDLIFN